MQNKILPLFVFQVLMLSFLTAQDTLTVIQPRSFLGLKGGATFSLIAATPATGTAATSVDILQGFTGGLVFQHFVERNPGVQIELNFIQKGWTEPDSLYERQLNYVELPFMTHINLGKGKFKFFLNLGPYAAYLISEQEMNPLGLTNSYHNRPLDKKFDYGLCGGAGFSLETGLGKFEMEGRYSNALSNLFTTEVLASSLNQGVQGVVSYSIRLSNKEKLKTPSVEPINLDDQN